MCTKNILGVFQTFENDLSCWKEFELPTQVEQIKDDLFWKPAKSNTKIRSNVIYDDELQRNDWHDGLLLITVIVSALRKQQVRIKQHGIGYERVEYPHLWWDISDEYILTPERHEDGVKHGTRLIEQIGDFDVNAPIGKEPIRAATVALRTHSVLLSGFTRFFAVWWKHISDIRYYTLTIWSFSALLIDSLTDR